MQQRLIELQLQRGRLLERIAHQRERLGEQAEPVTRILQLGDRVADIASECKRTAMENPLTMAALAGLVLLVRPRAAMRWAQRGFIAWRSWNTLRGVFARYMTPPR